MPLKHPISLRTVIRFHPLKVAVTWLMVLAENVMLVLLPLFIGYAIDGVLNQHYPPLMLLALLLLVLVLISVARRFYDTRVYGSIRVKLANLVERNLRDLPISAKDARLTMSRELVDFLEKDLPSLLTAVVQLVATLVILSTFHFSLALCMLFSGLLMLVIYGAFHRTFTQLNGQFNDQVEQQVTLLSGVRLSALRGHFERLKQCEIKLSDTEAVVYGLIFMTLFGAVIANLWMVSLLVEPSAGQVFSIVTYSLEFVETAVMLPITLQTLSRLTEISQRLNHNAMPQKEMPYEI
ncbi:ABC transporter permease [Vibrio navarrensis]|uniref:ABC transporter six-transmembrane domain-containing protein n=1 Tax=Vibrio navarrensis TaxID=29495 RepID=A0AAJ4IDI5_9VIBR|nr:ABC transporter six-transmembrane domain-containing protein [Vibrio navarrensis]MBE3652491.1 ABC transporter permease [Vibrio navarrensis]MBE3655777.1 ABC transporter permease [Vibrio navarrensis]QPL54604.1 ABC transporter six-transmembrane domain-containing protein [Vibrio navarrensis]